MSLRRRTWLDHHDLRSYFEPNEIRLIEEYRKLGFVVGAKSGPVVLAFHDAVQRIGERVLRVLAAAALLVGGAMAYRKKRLRELFSDPGSAGMLLFLALYSSALALSVATSVYDRYTLVNLVVLCLLAARVVTLGFGSEARS